MANNERKKAFETATFNGLENKKIVLDMGRRILAYEMATSGKEIPPVCFNYEPDITDFMAQFKKLKEERGTQISLNTIIMRCIVEGLKSAPILNSRLDYKYTSARGTLTMYDHVDINMPTILPDGTMQAINIKNADKMTLSGMDDYINKMFDKLNDPIMLGSAQVDLSMEQTLRFIRQGKVVTGVTRLMWAIAGRERIKIAGSDNLLEFIFAARNHKKKHIDKRAIKKADLEEGTVMITNVGSLYKGLVGNVTMFEIIPPEIFAVAIGSIQRRPVVKLDSDSNEVFKAATILPLALVFDHKAVDFDDIIPFIKRMDDIFSNPAQIVDW